ncbi:MAG TPA: glycosyltransferase, partial [Longimicrobiales bacterium]|nr:glycosyltransferase [Longimicrobiales bacterium]
VHTHGYRVDVLHGSVAAKLGIPRVSTSHGFVGGDLKNRFYERLQRRALRRFDGVVAVSAPMAATLAQRGIPADRLHTVPNAWTDGIEFLDREEARRMLQIPADEFHVGFIGRIGHEKGPDVLLEALSHLERPAATTFIGEGRLRDALAGRAEALGLDQTVRWAGLVQDAARLIRAFDAVVLSSRTEGTPVVLLEAMAAGVPVIAAAVGGIPHIVGPDEASLVPAEDPPALAAAIRDTRDDPRAAAGRAARASQRLRGELSAAQWLERYDRVYIASGVGTAVRR